MSTYETDEETVEAIKKWWKENGFSVIAGVVIGLGAIFGYRAWVNYTDSVGQQASAAFEQLLASSGGDDHASTIKQAELLTEEFSSTAYATLAKLVAAQVELQAGNTAGARAALEQAIAGSPDPAITHVAALRLARILLAEGDLAAASALVEKYDDAPSFAGAYAAVRGDIATADGRTAEAREAYEQAIVAGAPNVDRLRVKLDNLPPAG